MLVKPEFLGYRMVKNYDDQACSYVQARGGSCLLVSRRLNFFEIQINVIRNCVIRKKIWQKESYKPVHPIRSTPYVVTCNICQILWLKCTKFDFGWGSDRDPAVRAYSAPSDPLAGFKRAYFSTSLPTCLLLTHVALCQRVRRDREDALYNWLTYLLTSIVL